MINLLPNAELDLTSGISAIAIIYKVSSKWKYAPLTASFNPSTSILEGYEAINISIIIILIA